MTTINQSIDSEDINVMGANNNNVMGNGITFQILQDLKVEHAKLYEDSGNGSQIELLNYLYDVLDNINSEIIKQNKQRIKAKYGSLLPPTTIRNKQQSGAIGSSDDGGSAGDSDGFQPVMPKRSGGASKSGGRGARDGRGGGSRSSGSNSYNQPYRTESERNTGNPSGGQSGYKSGGRGGNRNSSGVVGNGIGNGGVLSKLLGGDRVKMAINRELNKISSANMDVIAVSITDIFAAWLLDELNNDIPVATIREKFQKYLVELWNNLIGKSLTQTNMSEVYFKFLRRIMSSAVGGAQPLQSLMMCLKSKSPVMASRLNNWQPGFHELSENKSALLDEINLFLKESEYFTDSENGLAEKVGGLENLSNIQDAFSILGLFAKYFLDVPVGRNRSAPSAWDIMLLAIYSNFKLLNELLYWEPVNLEEVERRVYFTVGFLEDNRGFIQSLDTDFYRDIECQLDSIKKCASIPASVKYKLFDCIDNFILMRKSGSTGRK
jgi:hypothetical protein